MGSIRNQVDLDHYLVSNPVERQVNLLRNCKRLVLTGYIESFSGHHIEMDKLLTDLAVPHTYRDAPKRDQNWESGCLV